VLSRRERLRGRCRQAKQLDHGEHQQQPTHADQPQAALANPEVAADPDENSTATRACAGAAGAYTHGKADAYRYRKRCHLGAIQMRWKRERVLAARARVARAVRAAALLV
jgi:hypothetical protein